MGMGYGDLLEDMFKGFVFFVVCAIIASSVITGVVVYSATKHSNDTESERTKYEETVESLTPEQRKILGL